MSSVTKRLDSLSPAKRALLLRAINEGKNSVAIANKIPLRAPGTQRVPLSLSQQRLWFLDQLDGPTATYNMPIAVRLSGTLNLEALTSTLQTIVDRHEVLRTTIETAQGEPFQRIHDSLLIDLPATNLSHLADQQRLDALAQEMNQEAGLNFDLTTGPLLRTKLIALGRSEHVLLLTIHHIICDGWSIGKVLLEEILACYEAFDQKRLPVLPELSIQFADYAQWQRTHLVDQTLEPHLRYWTDQLQGLPALLELPTDRTRPQLQTSRGDVHHFLIEADVLHALKSFGSQRKATLFMTLLSAFSALLARYAGQDDVAVGSPIAGRTHKELEPLIGFFVNTLVLRSRLPLDITVDEYIEQVRLTCLAAYEHQSVPFERLVEALKPERTQSFSPLFQVMFILQNQNQDRQGLETGGLCLESLPIDSKTAMFDMTLKLEEQGALLLGELEYNTDLFDLRTIERFVIQFKYLISAMIDAPQSRVLQLPLMPADQYRALTALHRHEQWDLPPCTLIDLIEQRVALHPDKTAVMCGEGRLTYLDLQTKSNALAGELMRHLGTSERFVGLCLSRSPDLIVAMLAVLKSGNAYVPIDPHYPQDRQLMMIEQAHLSLILTDEASCANLPELALDYWINDFWPDAIDHPLLLPILQPDQLAYVIFTSGSTGKPKGVQISHAALLNFLLSMHTTPGLSESDVLSAVTTISFDIAGLEIYLPLVSGATLDLVSRSVASDGFLLLDHLTATGSTVMQATPATWRMLFATGAKTLPLKRGFCGGEALDAALADQMKRANLDVWNLYGPTETTIWSAASRLADDTNDATDRRAPPIGQAIRGTALYVLNQWLEPAGLGIPGELYIAGLGLSRGYFEQAGLTAERFLPDPFARIPGARMYRTGDVVIERENGRLDYVGRTDFQVKVRGFRIELGEIESVLQRHEAVHHAVAIAQSQVGADARLIAYVQTASNWQALLQDPASTQAITSKWQTVWDQTYKTSQQSGDDFSGWLSSYTGQFIGDEPMIAWTDESVRKILELKPSRLLEIGCGTGLLASRLAPMVNHYIGVDFSATVLEGTRDRLAKAGLTNVTLLTSPADQVCPDDIGVVDTIVLNSVVQYFPSVDYLLAVLKNLLPCLSENGAIFLGDLRSLAHLRLQHASVQHHKSEPPIDADDLAQRIDHAIETEQELLIDARWFLTQALDVLERPYSSGITLKDGLFDTEMSRFRYDLVLYLDRCPDYLQQQLTLPSVSLETIRGTSHEKNPLETLQALTQTHSNGFTLHGLTNARLSAHARLTRGLQDDRSNTEPWVAVEPDDIKTWAAERGWCAVAAWDMADPEHCVTVTLLPNQAAQTLPLQALVGKISPQDGPPLANEPLRGDLARQLTQQLRAQLEAHLPAYMVPSTIITLEQLPLTPNGKIDRAALPKPDATLALQDYVPPQSDLEKTLCDLWSTILGLPKVGIEQNFFHLGGHSLLAVQVIAKIRDIFGTSLPIQTLFDAPTIKTLATCIDASGPDSLNRIDSLDRAVRARGPLSHAQRQLWFIEQLQGASAAYHVSAAAHVRGPLNIEALRESFLRIVKRHETLRTGFIEQDAEPITMVSLEPTLMFDVLKVPDENSIAQAIADTISQPFDLTSPGLLRIKLLTLNPHHHVLIMVIHHIVSDEWSIALIQQELAALYPAICRQVPGSLRELPIQYGDYAAWQRQQLSVEALRPGLEFWGKLLAGAPPLIDLPTDRPRAAMARQVGATIECTIPSGLITRLKTLAADHSVTLFMTLLAGWAALLSRRAGTDDLVIGVPMTDRSRSELEPLIGLFVNTLPVRVDLSGLPTTHTLLTRIGQRVVQAFSHQRTPLDKIIDAVKPNRNLAYTPLFQVVFVMQNAPKAQLSFADLKLETLATDAGASKFDLTLSVEESDDGLSAMVEYNTDLFDASTIKVMLDELQTLWLGMVDKPDWPVHALALQAPAHMQRLLSLPNPSHNPLPERSDHATDVIELFEAQARTSADKPALAAGNQTLDYKTLQRQVNHLSKQLCGLGIGPETVVGIHAGPSCEMVIAMLAVLKAGGAYLPLVPDTPAARLQQQIDIGRVSLLLDTTEAPAQWANAQQRIVSVQGLLQSDAPACDLPPPPSPNTLACLIFTSGSTGEPKGVHVSRDNLSHSVAARLGNYSEPFGALLLLQPFNFDVATGNILWTLCAGGCLHVESKQTAFEPAKLLERLVQTRASHLVLLPLIYGPLLSLANSSDLESLRCVIVGGEQMPATLGFQHQAAARHANLYNEYGPTETTVMCAAHGLSTNVTTELPALNEQGHAARTPIGKALGQSRLYVLNELMVPMPVGVAGELYIGGPQVSRGYAQQPGLTAERFTPDPFSLEIGARLYRSGDTAKLRADGTIELLGRTDQQVKIRGFRIEPGEIESVLTQIKGVEQAAVMAIARGQSKVLVAYAVTNPRQALTSTVLRDEIAARLPDYMVPTFILLLDHLPRTANGKLDVAALPPLPTSESSTASPNLSPTEAALASVWADVLGLPTVARDDNFFALGGDSILSIQAVSRARQVGLHFTVKALFETQTVAALAAVTAEHQATPDRTRLALPSQPGPIQQWFLLHNGHAPNHFNQSVMLLVDPTCPEDSLKSALAAVAQRHEMLQARFTQTDGQWLIDWAPGQPTTSLPYESIDLSMLAPHQQGQNLLEHADRLQSSLDIINGPLWRVARFRFGQQQPDRLLWIIHHLGVDGVSWRILFDDLESAVTQHHKQQQITLPQTATDVSTWLAYLQDHVKSVDLLAEQAFWEVQAQTDVDTLPFDVIAAGIEDNTQSSAQSLTVSLPAEVSSAIIRGLPLRLNAHINEILLTALYQVISQWSGLANIGITLEGHGRQSLSADLDLSETVGWFTTTYPVRLQANGQQNVWQQVRQIKATLQNTPHHGIGFGLLRYLGQDRAGRAQLAKVEHQAIGFNYLGQFRSGQSASFIRGQASEPVGQEHKLEGKRAHVIDINGIYSDDQLSFTWTYSSALHHAATIEKLATAFGQALTVIVEEAKGDIDDNPYTPGDFALARLTPTDIDRLYELAGHNVERAYPLSPTQHGMLFHTDLARETGAYVMQLSGEIRSPFRPDAFRQAWQAVLNRHDSLRTVVMPRENDDPIQVVLRELDLDWTALDWRHKPADQAQTDWRTLLAQDRVEGFDAYRGPLMRCTLAQISDGHWCFLWSHHHLLTDGWCLGILLKELLDFYQAELSGAPLNLDTPVPYENYIAWLQTQNIEQAKAYWYEKLNSLTDRTVLGIDRQSNGTAHLSTPTEGFQTLTLELSEEQTTRLSRDMGARGLTLSLAVQAAWATLLARYSGRADVVFGVTTAGRPPALIGVEKIVGLFITTLPVRAEATPSLSVHDLLVQLRDDQLARDAHAHLPLVDIKQTSGLAARDDLFDSLVVFENYPVDQALNAHAESLAIENIHFIEQTNYALTLTVQPGQTTTLQLAWPSTRFDLLAITQALEGLRNLLTVLPTSLNQRIDQWSEAAFNAQALAWQHRRLNAATLTTNGIDTPVNILTKLQQQIAQQPEATGLSAMSMGTPIDHTTLYILDPHGNPVPEGMPGELVIGGAGVTLGHAARPSLTAQCFIPNPFDASAGTRLYRTGDLVWLDPTGGLHDLGRIDCQLTIRGLRIELSEIETTIKQHPSVRECVVSVWTKQAEQQQLAAYVVFNEVTPVTRDIQAWLSGQLPAHMIPVHWVTLTTFPLTANGKVDREALPAPDLVGHPTPIPTRPCTPTEALVADLFKEVLAINDVGAQDDFFDLGGHSLLAGRLATRLATQLGIQIPIAALFEHSDVATLARYVDNLTWAASGLNNQDNSQMQSIQDETNPDVEEFRL